MAPKRCKNYKTFTIFGPSFESRRLSQFLLFVVWRGRSDYYATFLSTFVGIMRLEAFFVKQNKDMLLDLKLQPFVTSNQFIAIFLQMTALQYYTCQFIWAFASHSHKQEICNTNCHGIMEFYCFIAFYFHYLISILLMRGFTN